jgi:predicted nucleic acid-binding protein
MKTKLPLPDCHVVDVALRLKVPIVSFDKELNQIAQEIGIETLI